MHAKDALPWVEKYRPDKLDDLIAHEDIISTSECTARPVLGATKSRTLHSQHSHRQEQAAPFASLWTPWNWKDLHYYCMC